MSNLRSPERDAPYIMAETLDEAKRTTCDGLVGNCCLQTGHRGDCLDERTRGGAEIKRLHMELASWKAVAHDHSERLKVITADRDRHKTRADNHADTMRSIYEMNPATDGERMWQWASDALAGYIEPVEVTTKRLVDNIHELRAELDRLKHLINTPIIDDFMRALPFEAAHRQEKHGGAHDAGKTPEDWHWLLAYLANKACRYFASAKLIQQLLDETAPGLMHPDLACHLRKQVTYNSGKGLHHIITTAAACLNWYRHATGDATAMRPGTEAPTESAS